VVKLASLPYPGAACDGSDMASVAYPGSGVFGFCDSAVAFFWAKTLTATGGLLLCVPIFVKAGSGGGRFGGGVSG
jgi:hypothetical protein